MDHEDATQTLLRNLGFPMVHRADRIVQQLRAADPGDQLQALENLSSTLLMSREEGLLTFPGAAVVPELVRILDAPTLLAEIPYLSCRIITQLIDRGVPHILELLVENGVLEALHSRFQEIAYIDIVEQAIVVLEKVAGEYPAEVLSSGCIVLVLQSIDFFNVHVQRSILNVVALCVPAVNEQTVEAVRLIVPILVDHLQAANPTLLDLSISGVCLMITAVAKSHVGAQTGGHAGTGRDELRNLFEGCVGTLVSRIAPGDPLLTKSLAALGVLVRSMPFLVPELVRERLPATVARALTKVDIAAGYDNSVISTLLHLQKDTLVAAFELLGALLPRAQLQLPFSGPFAPNDPKAQGVDRTVLSDVPLDCLQQFAATCVQLASAVYSCCADGAVRELTLLAALQVCCLPRKILGAAAANTELVAFCCLVTSHDDPAIVLLGLCACHELLEKLPQLAPQFGQQGLDSELETLKAGAEGEAGGSDWTLASEPRVLSSNSAFLAARISSKLGVHRADMSALDGLVGSANWAPVIELVASPVSELLRANAFATIAAEIERCPAEFVRQWTPQNVSLLVSKLQESLGRTERCQLLNGAPTLAGALNKHIRMKIRDANNDTNWALNVQAIASVRNLEKFCQGRLAFYQFMGGDGNLFEALNRRVREHERGAEGEDEGEDVEDEEEDEHLDEHLDELDEELEHEYDSGHSEHDHEDEDEDVDLEHSDDEFPSDAAQELFEQQLDDMEDEVPDEVPVEQMPEEASESDLPEAPELPDAGQPRPALQFYYQDKPLSTEQSVLGAIWGGAAAGTSGTLSPELWTEEHTITFRRVDAREDIDIAPKAQQIDAFHETPDSMASASHTLQLLSVLADLNEKYELVPPAQFINIKLTSKLNRQLEDPLVVIAGILPQWVIDSVRIYPFLFPFESRHLFLKSTSFGYARALALWQEREDQSTPQLRMAMNRLVKQKYRISRKGVLVNALKVLGMTKKLSAVVEIEYYGEQGTGLGPTQEFYANVSRAFLRDSTQMWRGEIVDGYFYDERGVFPAPLARPDKQVLACFVGLGRFVARALVDERMLDLRINHAFFMLVLGKYDQRDLLRLVDPQFASTLFGLERQTVEGLGLDFTLPSYDDIELLPQGRDQLVTGPRLEEYVDLVVDWTVGRGVVHQVESFKRGFSELLPIEALQAFLPNDFYAICGQNTEDWSAPELRASISADHGYTASSKPVQQLIELMAEFDPVQRRRFLQFMTGSPNLPIGGFKVLKPPFTVVLKHAEDADTPIDTYLPSVMTCANYLKLPSYSSKAVMAKQLWAAIDGGSGVFPLS